MSLLDNDDILMEKTDIKYWGFPDKKDKELIDVDRFVVGYTWSNPWYIKNQIFRKGLAVGVRESFWSYDRFFPYSLLMYYLDEKGRWTKFTDITGHYKFIEDAYKTAYQILLNIQENPKLLHMNKKRAELYHTDLSQFNIK